MNLIKLFTKTKEKEHTPSVPVVYVSAVEPPVVTNDLGSMFAKLMEDKEVRVQSVSYHRNYSSVTFNLTNLVGNGYEGSITAFTTNKDLAREF